MLVTIFCALFAWSSVFPAFVIQEQKKPADQDQAVKLKTELVEVRAVVTDKEGKPVGGLKKEDFEIIEKGRPQEIGFFSEHRIEASGGRNTAQPGTPGPQDRPAPGESEALRSIVLVVDTLNLSGESLLRVKQTLKRFVAEHVTNRDAVMIVASGGTDAFSAHFMTDRWMLRYAIDRLQYWGSMRSSYFTPTLAADVKRGDVEAIRLAMAILSSQGLPADRRMADFFASDVLAEAEFRRGGLLNTVKFAAEILARAPGQRLLLLVSDGFSLLSRRGDHHAPDLQPVISKAARSGVVIYSVNAKGLSPAAGFDPALGRVTVDSRIFGALSRYMSAWEKDALEGMNALAKDTGGETFFKTNDML
ncbi:MAG TPA: VWA domain-containing protein, partial [Blastocatellia bacterium]|nr:VWA domain-containing protein [Blastocatellia bacterium]